VLRVRRFIAGVDEWHPSFVPAADMGPVGNWNGNGEMGMEGVVEVAVEMVAGDPRRCGNGNGQRIAQTVKSSISVRP